MKGMLISNYNTKQKSLIQMYLIPSLSSFFTPLVRSQDFFCCNLLQEWQLTFHSEASDSEERTFIFLGSQFCIWSAEEVLFGLCICDILYSSLSRHPTVSQCSLHYCKPSHTSLRIYEQSGVIRPCWLRNKLVWDIADHAQSQERGKKWRRNWKVVQVLWKLEDPSLLLCCICYTWIFKRDKSVCLKRPK